MHHLFNCLDCSWTQSVPAMLCANKKLSVFRHYMLVPWYARAAVTVFVVAFLSLLRDADEVKHVDALTSKDSILNQVFVKMGWAWTLCALMCLFLALLPLSSQPLVVGSKVAARALILTLVFYAWCAVIFVAIEHWTGICVSKNVVISRREKRKCIKGGHEFYSFDISGHAFLMVYCVLTLMQEAQVMRRYMVLGEALGRLKEDEASSDNESLDGSLDGVEPFVLTEPNLELKETLSDSEASKFHSVYMRMWVFVVLSYVSVCLLCLTWDVVLVITTIYYHTILEKLLGVIIGCGSFAFLYKFLFVKLKLL
ncbi:Fat storage-inducing transmembrane protein [Trinorchestia longiramus]|nr:Fat storage-inducing transmembrane protein [Trinorchestia longiramus]